MAPTSRKRKSEALEETPRPTTPTGSPARKKLRITASEKQILIDNLQLEITDRARRLRAHYALQCADLRSRVERRVNRIPVAMRKMTMRELIHKHTEADKRQTTINAQVTVSAATDRPLPPLPHETSQRFSPIRPQIHAAAPRGKKRKTSEIQIATDQENDEQPAPDFLPVTKKTRGKAAVPTRTASRTQKPASVLSPRSHNSRTLPRSPIKEPNSPTKSSPMKSMIARPLSPLKPASPLKSAASVASSAFSAAAHGMARGAVATAGKLSRTASREKTGTAANTKGKMLPPPRPGTGTTTAPSSPQRIPSSQTTTSEMSTTSTTTTVVTKTKTGRNAKAPAQQKSSPIAKKATSATKAKTALKGNTAGANKKVVVAEPATGRRVLRKRN